MNRHYILKKIKNFKKLLKNAEDLREVMDVTEQNAFQTIQQPEMSTAELQSVPSEIRRGIISQSGDLGKCWRLSLTEDCRED